jgi:uncharacterized protein (DUF2384 family)
MKKYVTAKSAKPLRKKSIEYPPVLDESMLLREPMEAYITDRKVLVLDNEFSYKQFKKMADQLQFTVAEWAQILHLSDRTIQRYAANNQAFEGIYADRLRQINHLMQHGFAVFKKPVFFVEWLKKDKSVLGQLLNFQSLFSSEGIRALDNQLGRIEYGVFA